MFSDKLFAIGDIHGCYDMLLKVLEWIEVQAPDGAEVVFLGDLVDRGPNSREVVVHLMAGPTRPQDEWVPIKGNHEAMMIKALDNRRFGDMRFWHMNGGMATCDSYDKEGDNSGEPPQEHIEWLRSLPTYHETEAHWFVHAGLWPGKHPDQHTEQHLLWMRDWEYIGKDPGQTYERHVVFGHAPRDEPFLQPHCTGLDTGSCFGGQLTVAEFDRYSPTGPIRIMQVDAKSGLIMVREAVTL